MVRIAQEDIAVIGGGNLGHLIGAIYGSGHPVRILSSKAPETPTWHGLRAYGHMNSYGGAEFSSNPEAVIDGASMIFVTVPSDMREAALLKIRDFIKPGARIVAIPAVGGWFEVANRVLDGLDVSIEGLRDIPFICDQTDFGKSVRFVGEKDSIFAAPRQVSTYWGMFFGIKCLPVTTDDILLTPANPIIHPGNLYGMFDKGRRDIIPVRPRFYEDMSVISGDWIDNLDRDIRAIRKAKGMDRFTIFDWFEQNYGSIVKDKTNLSMMFRTNPAYAGVMSPLREVQGGWSLKSDHRVFKEDIPFGLEILKREATQFDVSVPHIDEVLVWAHSVMRTE